MIVIFLNINQNLIKKLVFLFQRLVLLSLLFIEDYILLVLGFSLITDSLILFIKKEDFPVIAVERFLDVVLTPKNSFYLFEIFEELKDLASSFNLLISNVFTYDSITGKYMRGLIFNFVKAYLIRDLFDEL